MFAGPNYRPGKGEAGSEAETGRDWGAENGRRATPGHTEGKSVPRWNIGPETVALDIRSDSPAGGCRPEALNGEGSRSDRNCEYLLLPPRHCKTSDHLPSSLGFLAIIAIENILENILDNIREYIREL